MTIPNLITILRILLTPVFVIYLIEDNYGLALLIFAVCMISDGIDGFIARVFKQKSSLGTYLDPLADKLLLVTSFVMLSIKGALPSWLTVLVISRDVMILLGVLVLFLNNLEIHIKPSIPSKINTCLQFLTVVAVMAKGLGFLAYADRFYLFLFYLTALFTVSSGLHYMQYWLRVMGEGANKGDDEPRNIP